MRQRKLMGALILAVMVPFLGVAVPSSVSALEKLTACVPDINVPYGIFGIAQKMGYYEKEGLTLELTLMKGGICERALLAESTDFSLAPNVFEALLANPRGKIIYVGANRVPHKLMVPQEIKSVRDLKGKKIAISSFGGLTDVLSREIVKSAGLQPDKDVTLVVVGTSSARFAALKNGAVQAALLPGVFYFRALDAGYKKLDHKPIPYVAEVIGVLDKTLKERRDMVTRFVRATMKGHVFFMEKGEEALPMLKEFSELKSIEETKKNYEEVMERISPDGTLGDEDVKTIMDRANEMMNLAKPAPVEQVFDFSIVRQVNAEMKKSGWKP